MWAEEESPTILDQMDQPVPTAAMVLGSVRLVVRVSTDAVCNCFPMLLMQKRINSTLTVVLCFSSSSVNNILKIHVFLSCML